MGERPWEVGDERQRWEGYLDPEHWDSSVGQGVLRNLVRARDYDELREIEDAAVGMRAMTLRAHGIPGSYDLAGLQQVHRHLFQDVYEWAGDLRTVNIVKAGHGFVPTDQIESLMHLVAARIEETDLLRAVPEPTFTETLARVYNAVNAAHPFREGNGRTQREFITALARESGHTLDWTRVTGPVNDATSTQAVRGNLVPLRTMFDAITTSVAADPGGSGSADGSSKGQDPARQPRDPAFPVPSTGAPARSSDGPRDRTSRPGPQQSEQGSESYGR